MTSTEWHKQDSNPFPLAHKASILTWSHQNGKHSYSTNFIYFPLCWQLRTETFVQITRNLKVLLLAIRWKSLNTSCIQYRGGNWWLKLTIINVRIFIAQIVLKIYRYQCACHGCVVQVMSWSVTQYHCGRYDNWIIKLYYQLLENQVTKDFRIHY